jgi:hypothetical protein
MRSSQDENHLEEAIKTTLAQLCKMSTVYQSELLIEGTIGLTIDRKRVVLVHFQDCAVTSETETNPLPSNSLPSTSAATQDELCNLKLLGAETLSSLQDILTRPLVTSESNKPLALAGKQRAFSEASALDGTTIELDSDNESLSAMNFDSVEVKVKGGLLAKHPGDIKNTIVIDDDFFDPAPIDNAYVQDTTIGDQDIGVELAGSSNVSMDMSEFASEPSSPRTKKTRSTPKQSQCQSGECGKSLPTQSSLEAHLVAAHKITETANGKISHYTCKTCDKHFRFKAALKKHEQKHLNDRPFKCNVCQNSYSSAASLDIHMNVHSNRLKCDACKKAYSCKALFQKHIKYMHENV